MFSNSSIILLLPIHLLSLFQGQASCDVVCRFVQAEQWPSRGHIIARDCTYAVFPDIFMSFSYSYCRKETEKGIRVKGKKESGKGREKKEERKEGRKERKNFPDSSLEAVRENISFSTEPSILQFLETGILNVLTAKKYF